MTNILDSLEERVNTNEFQRLLQTIADGWNTKDAKKAVECFIDDAVYIEPPDKQFFQGKNQLYQYFGGDDGFDMKLTWHHVFFDEEKQQGAGEYTFEMNDIIHHGVAILELENGKIKLWREYDVTGNLSYEDFLKTEGKQFKFTYATPHAMLKA
ncbi:hypothetical protein A2875_01915 [Candidatus Gottesmanbacteria bacterium RIFCSPHIGHO2_01_FULL_46_14]|uniref:SnoaL-like domain-containing protein n=1 Tax=Candidatus Gottesmanbacteria bacterium RIFCSPHIGHO2_01_FULL_46_14 TaxID=1798380 RepID=A0A1F5ZK86_9BACT|nr:MAG: hypothetical protein A2875_01915 [Candidatus Gottesmanbacteria bacterium RIFCSPHIGHO2_01_FULL_46_14]